MRQIVDARLHRRTHIGIHATEPYPWRLLLFYYLCIDSLEAEKLNEAYAAMIGAGLQLFFC